MQIRLMCLVEQYICTIGDWVTNDHLYGIFGFSRIRPHSSGTDPLFLFVFKVARMIQKRVDVSENNKMKWKKL